MGLSKEKGPFFRERSFLWSHGVAKDDVEYNVGQAFLCQTRPLIGLSRPIFGIGVCASVPGWKSRAACRVQGVGLTQLAVVLVG